MSFVGKKTVGVWRILAVPSALTVQRIFFPCVPFILDCFFYPISYTFLGNMASVNLSVVSQQSVNQCL